MFIAMQNPYLKAILGLKCQITVEHVFNWQNKPNLAFKLHTLDFAQKMILGKEFFQAK